VSKQNKKKITPRYSIDIEAISRLHPSISQRIYSYLLEKIESENFSLESECYHCEIWDSGDKNRAPEKPGAHCSRQKCQGCAYSYLEPLTKGEEVEKKLELNLLAIKSINEELLMIEYSPNPDKSKWSKLVEKLRKKIKERIMLQR
jgi:hypothetical protein